MTIKLNPSTFNESSPGRQEDDIDSNELKKKERHARVKHTDDGDDLSIFGKDRSIYNEQNGTNTGAEPGVANGDPCTS